MGIIAVLNKLPGNRKGKPTLFSGRKAAILNAKSRLKSPGMASVQDTTGVLDRGMCSRGQPGNLREPDVSLQNTVGRTAA